METTATTPQYESSDSAATTPPPRPRVWPALLIIALFWAARLLLANLEMPIFQRFMGTLAATAVLMLAFLLWWSIDRRGRRGQRLVPVLAWLIGGVLVGVLSFKSLGPMPLLMTAMPWVFTAWALWIVLARAASLNNIRLSLAAVIVLTW